MRTLLAVALVAAALLPMDVVAQSRRTTARRPAPAPPKIEAASVECPNVLGEGVTTKRTFCDVQIGREPAAGVIVTIPPHTGDVTLTFDLHNRHTYSEEQVRANRAYHRYLAGIGVLTLDNTLISRAAILSEFRTAKDLFDRIGGGSGPGGLKAVAPTGAEPITLTIPAEFKADKVSILGEKLSVQRVDGPPEEFTVAGRPVAVISNVMLEYRPAPAPAGRRGAAPRR